MEDFRKNSQKDMEQYPLTISAEVKDTVLNQIIVSANRKEKATINSSDIEGWGISKPQYESIIKEFKNRGLVEFKGYDYCKLVLTSEISNFYHRGGFAFERDLYLLRVNTIELIFEKMERELKPSMLEKVNNIIGKANNVSDLVSGIKMLSELIQQ